MNSLALFYLTAFLLAISATASTSGIRRPSDDVIVELQQVDDRSDVEASMFARLFGDENTDELEEDDEDEDDVGFQDMLPSSFQGLRRTQLTEEFNVHTISAIGHSLAPMVDGILTRGLRASHCFNFGGALQRKYKFGGVDMTHFCNNEQAQLDGDLNLNFAQLGGWNSVTVMSDWETGNPRSRATPAKDGSMEWKVNFEFHSNFEQMYGRFNSLFATETIGCNSQFQLPEHEIKDIELLLDDSQFEIIMFAKGTFRPNPDGSSTAVVTKAQIKTMEFIYTSREVESDQLNAEAPWILNTSFGRTMELWVKECINKWVLPALERGMNKALKRSFPTTVDMAPPPTS